MYFTLWSCWSELLFNPCYLLHRRFSAETVSRQDSNGVGCPAQGSASSLRAVLYPCGIPVAINVRRLFCAIDRPQAGRETDTHRTASESGSFLWLTATPVASATAAVGGANSINASRSHRRHQMPDSDGQGGRLLPQPSIASTNSTSGTVNCPDRKHREDWPSKTSWLIEN